MSSPFQRIPDIATNICGIYVFFISFGFLNEKVLSSEVDGEKYHFYAFFMLVATFTNMLVGYYLKRSLDPSKSPVKHRYLMLCSVLYIGSIFLAGYSMEYVNYPAKVFLRSCKSVSIILFGYLADRKRYPISKYFVVLFLTLGAGLFFVEYGRISRLDTDGDHELNSTMLGLAVLVSSLIFEGLLSTVQESIRRTANPPPNFGENMFFMNIYCVAILSSYNFTFRESQFFPAISYLSQDKLILMSFIGAVCTHALGQSFVFRILEKNGTLTLSVVNLTCKFFTIMLSVWWNGHFISEFQWVCVIIVFVTLIVDVHLSHRRKQMKNKMNKDQGVGKEKNIDDEKV